MTANVRHESDPAAVDDHRTGAALAVIAALLGAGEMQVLAQRVEQRGPGIQTDLPDVAVHLQRYVRDDRRFSRGRLGSGHRGRQRHRHRGGGTRDEKITPAQIDVDGIAHLFDPQTLCGETRNLGQGFRQSRFLALRADVESFGVDEFHVGNP